MRISQEEAARVLGCLSPGERRRINALASGSPLHTGVAGSNSGSHVGSASVSGLPSVSASRIAVIGRQNCQ